MQNTEQLALALNTDMKLAFQFYTCKEEATLVGVYEPSPDEGGEYVTSGNVITR